MIINEKPSNDDEKFWSLPLGIFNIDSKINCMIKG